ncbi:hypothetical protein K493DRAFT_332953 [Basidiobolus meristosporus CBS 931.73]|uniref:Mus7/MMS22 family-domain-containing protein n=1 Tax=Basidiobolus meristosporus CBS 931.73 TaxID=1314790 RepID=A0A1Y1ZAH7_9FUNG|nr:hypothetical protein K493DRAFT_332953 [Basidiobolus meristosporus CBS 931.73]|eukprot:ORY06805.1 hypothetical protein K493DRAFT_332953 [Basidiobolus meristosporus CBS 931.73]
MSDDTVEDELGILYANQNSIDKQLSEIKSHTSITVEIPQRPVSLENYENNELILAEKSTTQELDTVINTGNVEDLEKQISDLSAVADTPSADTSNPNISNHLIVPEKPASSAFVEEISTAADKYKPGDSINAHPNAIHPPLLLNDSIPTKIDVQDGINPINISGEDNERTRIDSIENSQIPDESPGHNDNTSNEAISNDRRAVDDETQPNRSPEKETLPDTSSNLLTKYPLRKRTALSLHPYTRFSWTDPETLPNVRIDTSVLEEPIEPEDNVTKGKHDYYDSEGDNDYTDTQTRRFASSVAIDEDMGLIPDESELQALLDDTLVPNSHARGGAHHRTVYKRKRKTKSLVVKLALPGYRRQNVYSDTTATSSNSVAFQHRDEFSDTLARADEYLQALGTPESVSVVSPSRAKLGRRLMILDDEDEASALGNSRLPGPRSVIVEPDEAEALEDQSNRRSKYPPKLTKRNLAGKLPASFLRVYNVDNTTLQQKHSVQPRKSQLVSSTSSSPSQTSQVNYTDGERPLSPTSVFSDEMSGASDLEARSDNGSEADLDGTEAVWEKRPYRKRGPSGGSRKQKPINFVDIYELLLEEYADGEVPIFLRIACRRLIQKYNWGYDISDDPWAKMISFDPNFVDDDAYQEDQFTLSEWRHGGDFWRRKLRRLRRQRNALKKSQESRSHPTDSSKIPPERSQSNQQTSRGNPIVRKRKRPSRVVSTHPTLPDVEPRESQDNEIILLTPGQTEHELKPALSPKTPPLPGKRKRVPKSKLEQKLDKATTEGFLSTLSACKKLKGSGAKRKKVAAFVKTLRKRKNVKDGLLFASLDVSRTVANTPPKHALENPPPDYYHENQIPSPRAVRPSAQLPLKERPFRFLGVPRPMHDTNLSFKGKRQRLETIIGKIKRLSLNTATVNAPSSDSLQSHQSHLFNNNLPSYKPYITTNAPITTAKPSFVLSPRVSTTPFTTMPQSVADDGVPADTPTKNAPAISKRKRKGIAHRLLRPQSREENKQVSGTVTATETTSSYSNLNTTSDPLIAKQIFHTQLNSWYMQNKTSRFTPKPLISAQWFNESTFLGRGELNLLLKALDGNNTTKPVTMRVFEIFDADIMATTTIVEFTRIMPPFLSQFSDHICRIWELEKASQKVISGESEAYVIRSVNALLDFVTKFLQDHLPVANEEEKRTVFNVLGTECTYLLKRLDSLARVEWPDYSSAYWSLKTIGETYLHMICWSVQLHLSYHQLESPTYPCFSIGEVSKSLIRYLRKFPPDQFKLDTNDQGCSSWGGSIVVCLIHILDRLSQYTTQEELGASHLATPPFWSMFNEVILEDSRDTTEELQDWDFPPLAEKGEGIWNYLFAIVPLYQFNESGVYCSQRKCPSNWSLVQYLLETMSGLLELGEKASSAQFSHRQSRMLDQYVRSLFGRCYELCTMWQWDPDQKVLLLLYRFYEKRQFKDLSSESHPYFPRSLKEFSGIIPREIQVSDTCFHILLKFIYFSLNAWCERAASFKTVPLQEKSKREVRSFVSRISPTRVLKFTKSQATSDYSPLLNHYNLMLVFALTIPSSIRARSTVQMKSYLNFDESDQMSRKIHIEGFTLLGLIYQHRRENIQPILEVLNERMSQVSQEFLDIESKRSTPYVPSIFGERPSDEWLSESDRVKLAQNQANVAELIELIFGQYRRLAIGEDYLGAGFISTAWSTMLDPALKFPHKIRVSCIAHVNNLLKVRTDLRDAFSKGSVAGSTTDLTVEPSRSNEGSKGNHESPDDFDDFEFDDLDLDQLYVVEQEAVKTETFKTHDQPFATALDKINTGIRELVFAKYIIDLSRSEMEEKYSLHSSAVQKAVECWVDCIAISVEHGLRSWDAYFLSQSADSWTTVNNATGRKIISLYFVTRWQALYQNTTKYLEQIINIWFQTIVEPGFTVQHTMTSALLNQAVVPKIFYNLPIAIHSKQAITKTELVRLRSAIIGAVLSNMGDDYSFTLSSNPELCAGLKKKYHGYLKSMLSSLKDCFEANPSKYLNSPALFNEKENYIKLIHDIVGNVIEHCSAIMYQSDSFSTQLPELRYFMSKDFPLPPADHFYITQRLRGFSKLNYSTDPRLQKSLVEFFQTHLETIFGQIERERQDDQKLRALVASFLNTSKQSDNTAIWNTTVASFRMFIYGTIIKRYITCFIRRSELATLAIPALRLTSMILDSLSDEYWNLEDPVQGITSLQKEMSILLYPLTNALTQCHTDSHSNSVVHRIISKYVLQIFINCVKIFRHVHIDYRHFYAHNKEWASLLEQSVKIAYLKSILMVRDILPKKSRQEAFFQDCQDALSTEHINVTELSMLAPNRYFSFERQFPSTLLTRQIGECYSTRPMDEVAHELLATIFEFWSQIASFYPHIRASIIQDFSNIKLHHLFKFVEHSRISNLHFKTGNANAQSYRSIFWKSFARPARRTSFASGPPNDTRAEPLSV